MSNIESYLIILGLFFTSCWSFERYRCPSQLKRDESLKVFGEYCFNFINIEMYWTEASKACANIADGHQVVVNDSETQNFLIKSMDQLEWTNNGVWIGLHETNGNWKWVTGEPLSWSNWDLTEPNNGGLFNEDCGLLWRKDGKWHDYPCERLNWKYRSVCQYNMEPETTLSPEITTETNATLWTNTTGSQYANTTERIHNKTSIINPNVIGRRKTKGAVLETGVIAGIIVGVLIIVLFVLVVVAVYCRKRKRGEKSDRMFDNVTYEAQNDSSRNRQYQNIRNQEFQVNSGRYGDFPGYDDAGAEVNYEECGGPEYAIPSKRKELQETDKEKDSYLTPYSSANFTNNNDGACGNLKADDTVYYEEPKNVDKYDEIDISKKNEGIDSNVGENKPLNEPALYMNVNSEK